jgi:hypothetical protein
MIIVSAMERMSSEVASERTVTALKLPDEEMKVGLSVKKVATYSLCNAHRRGYPS